MVKFIIIGTLSILLMIFIYEDSIFVGAIMSVFIVGSLIGGYVVRKLNRKSSHKKDSSQ
ncbi:MAG: hypothetical protein ACOCXQ_03225 [Patescibacteria group bacterium]